MTHTIVMKRETLDLSGARPELHRITVQRSNATGKLSVSEERIEPQPVQEHPGEESGDCYETEIVHQDCVNGQIKITTITQLWCDGELVRQSSSYVFDGDC